MSRKSLKIQPRHDWIYLESFPDSARSEDITNELARKLIILPDCAKEPSRLATVRAVGPGLRVNGLLIPVAVEVGQVVLCPRYGGEKARSGGEEFFFMKETEILAKVTNARN